METSAMPSGDVDRVHFGTDIGGTVPARRDTDAGIYAIFAAQPRSYSSERPSRIHMPTKPRTRRIAFWLAVVIPLLLVVCLGCCLAGAASTVAKALLHAPFAPLVVFVLRVATWVYFSPSRFAECPQARSSQAWSCI